MSHLQLCPAASYIAPLLDVHNVWPFTDLSETRHKAILQGQKSGGGMSTIHVKPVMELKEWTEMINKALACYLLVLDECTVKATP